MNICFISSANRHTSRHLDNTWPCSCGLILYFILIHLITYTTAETRETNTPPHKSALPGCTCIHTLAWGTKTVCLWTSSLSSPPHLCLPSPLLPLSTSPHPHSKQAIIQQLTQVHNTLVCSCVFMCERVCVCLAERVSVESLHCCKHIEDRVWTRWSDAFFQGQDTQVHKLYKARLIAVGGKKLCSV